MELFSWLKLKIKNLNFSHLINFNVTKIENNYNIGYPVNPNDDKVENIKGEAPKLYISQKQEFEFTDDQKFLIKKINKVHGYFNQNNFDFTLRYQHALTHMRDRPTDDWYECVAKDFVHVLEGGNLWEVFEDVEYPSKKSIFLEKQKYITKLYNLIQIIKHTDVNKNALREFNKLYKDKIKILQNQHYQKIFDVFQKELVIFFLEFKLKDK